MTGVNLLLVENISTRRVVILPRCVVIYLYIEHASKEAFFDTIDVNEKKGSNLRQAPRIICHNMLLFRHKMIPRQIAFQNLK